MEEGRDLAADRSGRDSSRIAESLETSAGLVLATHRRAVWDMKSGRPQGRPFNSLCRQPVPPAATRDHRGGMRKQGAVAGWMAFKGRRQSGLARGAPVKDAEPALAGGDRAAG